MDPAHLRFARHGCGLDSSRGPGARAPTEGCRAGGSGHYYDFGGAVHNPFLLDALFLCRSRLATGGLAACALLADRPVLSKPKSELAREARRTRSFPLCNPNPAPRKEATGHCPCSLSGTRLPDRLPSYSAWSGRSLWCWPAPSCRPVLGSCLGGDVCVLSGYAFRPGIATSHAGRLHHL